MTTARFTLAGACALGLIALSCPVFAQDRTVSIPDVWPISPDDARVAQEVTLALRVAASMRSGWRISRNDLPLTEMMFSCGASSEVAADTDCLQDMAVRREPEVANGLLLLGMILRSTIPGPTLTLRLVLYDNITDEPLATIDVEVDRILSPSLRNQQAAEWMRMLTTPPPAVMLVSETALPSETVDESPAVAEPDPPVEPDPADEPTPPTGRTVTDTTATDVVGWVLVGTAIASAATAGITGGLLLNLNEDMRFRGYRESWDAARVSDVCDLAANDSSADGQYAFSVCGQAATLEILTHVMWAASGALAFAGMVFIIWHPGAPSREVAPTTVRLAPILGPTRAGLDLTIEF